MLIITGTGRSGTETLARILGGRHEFRAAYIVDKYFSKADPHEDPFDNIAKRIGVVLDLHQGVDRETFIDSSNLYIHFIDAVCALNPSAKFILSVRNGKDFVRSALSRKWHEHASFGAVPPRDDPYFERWGRMTPLQRNAWIWVYRNRKALQGLRQVPETQRLVVRIEDIEKPEVLAALEMFSGVKAGGRTKRHNANPSFDLPPKEEWTAEMNREFNGIAEGMMWFLGYA